MNRVHGFYMHGGPTRKAERFASLVNFKVWPRMSGDCRKVNPPVESCPNGKVVILRRHAQTDGHPVKFVLREVATVRFDKLGGLAHPGHRAPVFPKKRSAANCNAQHSRNPVSTRTRFSTELRILVKPSTSRGRSRSQSRGFVQRFRAITQLFRDVLAKNGPITLCISVA